MNNITDDELLEQTLSTQIKDYEPEGNIPVKEEVVEHAEKDINPASQYIGQKISHMPGSSPYADKEADEALVTQKKLSRVGEKLYEKSDIREGWLDVSRELLGERSVFYPESWQFKIRPATVETIRYWSMIDDENASVIDDTFNDILKTCLKIETPEGPLPWGNIAVWDRFFFILLVREYTFINGEKKVEFEDECPECGEPIKFTIDSQSLMYELPDPEIMPMYDQETRTWTIDPMDYDVQGEPVKLYVPTVERDAALKEFLINKIQESRGKTVKQILSRQQVFLKFLVWLAPKISKDVTIAKRQIRDYEAIFNSWDIDMFDFMNEVIANVVVTQESKLIKICEKCGEEVTSDINQFRGKVSDLFSLSNRRKKFGSK